MYINISKVDFGKYYRGGSGGGGVTPEPEKDYLCFTSSGDSTVTLRQIGTPTTSADKVIQYKLNDGEWQTLDVSGAMLHDGDKMYLKSDDTKPISEAGNIYKYFEMSGSIAASGNIMSLLNFSDTLTDYAFYKLFMDCTSLTQAPKLPVSGIAKGSCYEAMFKGCTELTTAPELPATTLESACYKDMFAYCSSLTTAPELPATTLAAWCYSNMFESCTSLTTTPELPATTLGESCYESMFSMCMSLTQAPTILPTTTLATSCYYMMFKDCTSLTQAPALPATTLATWCYSNMFEGCTSLVQAPELPATTIYTGSYYAMFSQCSKLNYVKAMFTDIPTNSLTIWLDGVSPTGTFVKNSAATWTNEDAGIPTGWTVETTSPDK